MSRPVIVKPDYTRVKFDPPRGMLPALQYLLPAQLSVDPAYQRTLDTDSSKRLVRAIAQRWNWDLCQPLVVARRADGALYVIDGQHRLEAARLRGDIAQLPAVVVQYSNAADEAANFVNLNQQRRPLTKIDLFKAAIASGDAEAMGIAAAIQEAGLTVAPHLTSESWKPGMVGHIGGIEACWRQRGPVVTRLALKALAEGFADKIHQYSGTIFAGVIAVVLQASNGGEQRIADELWHAMVAMIAADTQATWRQRIFKARSKDLVLTVNTASEQVFRQAWRKTRGLPDDVSPTRLVFHADRDGTAWCRQCEQRCTQTRAQTCVSRFCAFRVKA